MNRYAIAIVLYLAAFVIAAPATKPAKPAAGEAGETRIADIDFAGLTAKQAVDAIAVKAGVAHNVDWKALEAGGVSATAKVRGRLMDVTPSQALRYVLSEIGADSATQGEVEKAQITIVIKDDLKKPETRVYSVGPQLERMAAERAGVMPKGTSPAELRSAAIDHLIRMITTHIQPATWRDAGGVYGTITITGTRMTVTNTREAMKEIDAYLKELDKPRK